MGDNNSLPETVIAVWADGIADIFRPADLREYDPTEYGYALDDPGPPGEPGFRWDEQIVIETTIAKYFRCRSRKRLIKLLMTRYSRNTAERMARQIHGTGLSYQEAWQQIWPQLMFI